MADQPDHRLYRQAPRDGYRDVSSGTPAPSANDPLAELARLIGNDSFVDRHAERSAPGQINQPPAGSQWDAPHPQHQISSHAAAAAYPEQPYEPAPQQAAPYGYAQPDVAAHYPAAYDQQTYDQQSYAQQGYAPQDFAQPQQHAPHGYPAYAQEPAYAAPAAEQPYHDPYYAAANAAGQHYAVPGTEPTPGAGLRHPPPFLAQQGFPPAGYAHDEHAEDDYYDDAVIKRRRMVLMAGAAVALVVIGTAGAFGYRALFSSTSSGPPPVIKADASPTKIVAAAPRDNSAGKSIQDRIGDQINEKLVSREEQPADVRPQPRVVFPGPTAGGGNGSPQATGSSAMASSGEPKKIRTVAIRPDGPDSGPAPRTPAAPARTASVAPAAPVAPPPQAPAQAPVVRQAAPANAPLSLSPDAAPAPSAPVARPATRAPAQVASVTAPGAYVQVASQRSEGDAQASFRALQGKYPAVLGNRSAVIHRADLGDKGTYYRAMIGPLGGPEAVELCSSLKAAGGSCVIQKN